MSGLGTVRSARLKRLFEIRGYTIDYDDARCMLATRDSNQKIFFILKEYTDTQNPFSISIQKLKWVLSTFEVSWKAVDHHYEPTIMTITKTNKKRRKRSKKMVDYTRLDDGALTRYGWHAEEEPQSRQNALYSRIIGEGVEPTLKTLRFLANSGNWNLMKFHSSIREDIEYVLANFPAEKYEKHRDMCESYYYHIASSLKNTKRPDYFLRVAI